jgi:hypothetical protein
MTLWVAAALFVLFMTGTALSFRAYFRGEGEIFLAFGIAASLICLAALAYAALTLFFVSSVK